MSRDNIHIATEAAAELKRSERYCKRGHKFNEKNTWWDKAGHRNCKICAADSQYRTRQRIGRALRADPDDPRHGTLWGYTCGCRCLRCAVARSQHRTRTKGAA